jgi:shikimate kinase
MKTPIFLCGMPGSGKSTVGKKLAARLGIRFIDLDTAIEERTGKSPAAWIVEEGEQAFRTIESEVLRALNSIEAAIVSCGGGTPCFNDNLSWMLQHGKVVYLEVPIGMLLQRLQQADADERPLLSASLSFEGLAELYAKRKTWYDQILLVFRPHEEKLVDLLESLRSGA